MLLSGSATQSRVITPEQSQLRLDESLFFVNTQQWYCAYQLLSPLENHTKSIAVLYNLGLCYYHIDEFDRAIPVLQQALILSQSANSSSTTLDSIKSKLLQQELQSENYLFALTPYFAECEQALVQQRLKRLLIDIYAKKSCWQDVLNLARQFSNDCPNVQKAQQLALHSLNDVNK